jgi:hypothetical protein
MTKDKVTEALVEALKQALAEPGEQRLYKSGKLAGMFAGRAGVNGDAAALALRDGLVELVRTETKGKAVIEWVRLTPSGVRYLHEHESPIKVLEELRLTLQATCDGLSPWLADMRQRLESLDRQLAEDAKRFLQHLDALTKRVDEGLQRLHAASPQMPHGVADAVPWALEAISYLDQRQAGGAPDNCPLPELFAALAAKRPDLSMSDFHQGLRHLRDWHALRLLPFTANGALPQPEYALLEGDAMLYFAKR